MHTLHGWCYAGARWILIGLVVLLPVFVIPIDWILVQQSKALLIGGATLMISILWIMGSISEGFLRVPKRILVIAAAFLPFAYVVSAISAGVSWSSYIGDAATVDTVVAMVTFYILFVVTASLFSERGGMTPLRALVVGGGVLTLVSIMRLFVVNDWTSFGGVLAGAATSTIGGWHDLNIFLGLFAFLIFAASQEMVQKGFLKLVLYAFAIVAALLLVVTNFADVWYGLAALFGVYGFLSAVSLWKEGVAWRAVVCQKTIVSLAITLLALGFGYWGSWVHDRLPQSLQVAQMEVRPSWQGTFAVGEKTLVGRQLFFGTGPNTFVKSWNMYKPPGVNETEFWGVDFPSGVGTVPTTVVTTGLLGALAWVFIIVALLLVILRHDAQRDKTTLILTISALFLTAFQVFYTPGVALSLITFLMYGFLIAHLTRAPDNTWRMPLGIKTIQEGSALFIVCLAALLIIGMTTQSTRRLVSDILINRAVIEYGKSGDIGAVGRSITWALKVFPESDRAQRAVVELGLLQLQNLSADEVKSEDGKRALEQTLVRTIEHALSATVVEEGNYQNWLTLAKVYAALAGSRIEGAEENARSAYNKARETNPTSPVPVLNLAELELSLGNTDAARTLLLEALKLQRNLPVVYYLLSQIDMGAGDVPRAREAAAIAAELANQDPLAWYNLGAILYAAKDYSPAVLALDSAVALKADYADALFVLALSHYELGNKEKALTILETLTKLDPSNELPKRAIENIKKGRAPLAQKANKKP